MCAFGIADRRKVQGLDLVLFWVWLHGENHNWSPSLGPTTLLLADHTDAGTSTHGKFVQASPCRMLQDDLKCHVGEDINFKN